MLKKFIISLLVLLVGFGCSKPVSNEEKVVEETKIPEVENTIEPDKTAEQKNIENIDFEKIASDIVSKLGISDKVFKFGKSDVENFLYLDEGSLDSGVMYLSNDNTSDMVWVVSSKDIKTLKQAISSFIEQMKLSNKEYLPNEVEKLNNALIVEKKGYIILVVSKNVDDVKSIIDDIE